ncbi:MAG: DUF3179 domain-containing protein [Alphaproteobacteria bacterium]|nr:DUF3179 domain-containing protein [Alphaproteobacteria bacterium]
MIDYARSRLRARAMGAGWPCVTAPASVALVLLFALAALAPALANPSSWKREWPKTDFSKTSVEFNEILSGGPPKDGIPSIDDPKFLPVEKITELGEKEPVITVEIEGDLRGYPLRILTWHEIVNDTVGGVPVAVTYCPLCNSALVFDRRLDGQVLEFGTTGKLRNSDLVMYDRQTESWWQQFMGEAIIGELTGKRLKFVPVRVESFARFKARGAHGRVLVPTSAWGRRYGQNPYVGYDGRSAPYPFFRGDLPDNVPPLERVVVVGKEAWAFSLLREKGRVERDDLVITWEAGQNSALDTRMIAEGRDVGNVVVQRKTEDGMVDAVHDVSFAFAFHAFHPDGTIHAE